MIKSFSCAAFISAIVLIFAFLGYIPSYIGVTVSVCAFATAIAVSLSYEIRNSIGEIKETQRNSNASALESLDGIKKQLETIALSTSLTSDIKEEQNKANASILESFESLGKMLTNIKSTIEQFDSSSSTQVKEVASTLEKTNTSIDEISSTISKEMQVLASKLESHFSIMREKNDAVTNSIGEIKETQRNSNASTLESLDGIKKLLEAIALSTSLTSDIKEEQNKANASILESFESLGKMLANIKSAIEQFDSSSSTQVKEVASTLEKTNTSIDEISSTISKEMQVLASKLESHFSIMGEKNDAVTNTVSQNSSILAKLNDKIEPLGNNLQGSINTLKESAEKNSNTLCMAFGDVTKNLTDKIGNIVSELNTLSAQVKAFSDSAASVNESNSTLCSTISEVFKTVNESVSKIPHENRHMIEDFKDTTTTAFDDFKKEVKKVTEAQTELLSSGEDNIRKSVDSLCKSLNSNLQKLDIDVDAICNTIEDMKKMSQSVEQSDKELLMRISKLCK